MLGITIAVRSGSWFSVWIGLELNLMSFIPLILIKDNQYSSEAALKYFLIQALGSTVLLISAAIILIKFNIFSASLSAALLLKAGAAPFHSWFPPTLEGILWPQALTLITVQKVAPISLLSYYVREQKVLISISVILSALVGALGGLNQTLLRKLLAYSSINHIAWMMSALILSERAWFLYFIIYSVIRAFVVLLLMSSQRYHFNHLIKHSANKPAVKVIIFIRLLSLGGLPPFTGFIPKWIIIQQLCSRDIFLLLFFLLGSSLFTLFYYLRMTLRSLTLRSFKTKWAFDTDYRNKVLFLALTANLCGIFVPSLLTTTLI